MRKKEKKKEAPKAQAMCQRQIARSSECRRVSKIIEWNDITENRSGNMAHSLRADCVGRRLCRRV